MDQRDICCSTAHQQHRLFQHPAIEGVPMEFQLKTSLAPAPEIAENAELKCILFHSQTRNAVRYLKEINIFYLPTRKTLRRVDHLSTSKEELWSYRFFEQETLFRVF